MSNANDVIHLHPQYGLNPTICQCYYCGQDKNEIALLGRHYQGEAPIHMVTSLEPCDDCKAKYADYTLLIEMEREWDVTVYSKRQKEPQPTGRWCAVRRECLNILPTSIAYVEPEVMNQILG